MHFREGLLEVKIIQTDCNFAGYICVNEDVHVTTERNKLNVFSEVARDINSHKYLCVQPKEVQVHVLLLRMSK